MPSLFEEEHRRALLILDTGLIRELVLFHAVHHLLTIDHPLHTEGMRAGLHVKLIEELLSGLKRLRRGYNCKG